ncbi:MAG: cytochrome P450 [Chloroflexi bacterium]|nr:cytochrome P450 [Chloroflexota bacterium]
MGCPVATESDRRYCKGVTTELELRTRPGRTNLDWFRTMRDEHPIWWDDSTRSWNAFRYADVSAILGDYHTFSSDFSKVFPDAAEFTEGNIVAMDPPHHHQLRGLVSLAFSPKAIAQLEERIAALTEELLDATNGNDQLELVNDLAYPLPVTVIAEMLGVPAADRPLFKTWADALLQRPNQDRLDRAALEDVTRDLDHFRDYLHHHVERRRAEHRSDLLGDLVAAEIDGHRLSDAEIVGFATLLLLAGHITTTILLGNTILCLDEYPDVRAALRTDPRAIPSTIEEVLRFRSPFSRTARVTTSDVQLGGQHIPAQALVNVWLLSANHDERQFAQPEEFCMHRNPNPHLAFGKGIHYCLGAPLARLEARIALGILLRRFDTLRVDPAFPLEAYANSGMNGVKSLHLQVQPRGPLGEHTG